MAAIVLFCLALLVCIVLGTNILYALLAGLVIFTLYGKKQGFSWKELGKMICSGVKTSASVLLVFPLIGILTAFWRACGTLPFIICCAVDLIRPEILLLMTFLLNCGVSMLTGTAFGTAATMGTICVSVGISMGMDPVLLGGAMLSGVYFGDRCSPVSTSALLVSELTETNIYDNIKRMLKTALVPVLLSCGVYAALGMVKSGSGAAGELWSLYGREMTLHWVMCLPAVLILILSVLRVNVKKAMSASILAAVVLCIFLRHLDAVTILKTAILGYTASDAEVGAMLNGGGIISMVRVALIVMISSAYSGIFRKTGLLDGLCGFLIYNFHPAKVFMGDTGSLFLGGAVAALAFAYDMPLVLIPVGIVYICETLSDILQVGYFKLTHGKRIFKMAPLHHHFEMCGWKETKIVAVFTTVSVIFCALAYLGVMNRFAY